ncbi:MAG: hypothetical protein QXD13_00395 [Candidatus Pacearchaeota archaeon]
MRRGAKKGAGNVEFIISFILFVSFAAAAIYFFNPTRSVGTMENAKIYVFNEVAKNMSVDIDSYSGKTTCSNNVQIAISGTSGKNARVEDYSSNLIESEKSGESICFSNDRTNKFVTLKFSEDFEEGDFSCINAQSCLDISSSIKNKVISEKRVIALEEAYLDNYDKAKNILGVPSNVDFGFVIEFLDGSKIEAVKGIPAREIFSETRRVEVLRTNGKSEFASLNVKVW